MGQELDTELEDLHTISNILMKHDKETRQRMVFYLMAKYPPDKRTLMPMMKGPGKIQ